MIPPSAAGSDVIIDMKSRDRNGNITEHIRIHPDGREEIIIARKEKQD